MSLLQHTLSIITITLLCILLAGSGSSPAAAEEVFHWRDKNGNIHFSDSPAKVPAGTDVSRRTMEAPDSKPPLQAKVEVAEGKEIWDAKCSECHTTGQGRSGDKLGLAHTLVDPASRFPVPLDQVLVQLQPNALQHEYLNLNISEEDIRSIAQYLMNLE